MCRRSISESTNNLIGIDKVLAGVWFARNWKVLQENETESSTCFGDEL